MTETMTEKAFLGKLNDPDPEKRLQALGEMRSVDKALEDKRKECTGTAEETKKQVPAEIIELADKNFKSPDILKKILDELDSDHVGDRRSKMFLLCTYISSLLRPEYRMSAAILGDSSVGKDSLNSACIKHVPRAGDFSRITGSCLEDNISDYGAIYVNEGNFQRENGSNSPIIEELKSLSEGGMRVRKKDPTTGFRSVKESDQPRKSVIFSTTDTDHDSELSTRFCIISVRGYPKKTAKIWQAVTSTAASPSAELASLVREESGSWIKAGLESLPVPDIISIMYADEIPIDNSNPRAIRDGKRFLNLIRILAFINQHNRPSGERDGKKFIFAVPEDLIQALEIAGDIFAQSFSDLEGRLQETIGAVATIAAENKEEWVDRQEIQMRLKIRHRDTIKKRVKALKARGILDEKTEQGRVYYRLGVQSGAKCPLIPTKNRHFVKNIKNSFPKKLAAISGWLAGGLAGSNFVKPIVISLDEREAANFANKHTERGKNTPKTPPEPQGVDEISGQKLAPPKEHNTKTRISRGETRIINFLRDHPDSTDTQIIAGAKVQTEYAYEKCMEELKTTGRVFQPTPDKWRLV